MHSYRCCVKYKKTGTAITRNNISSVMTKCGAISQMLPVKMYNFHLVLCILLLLLFLWLFPSCRFAGMTDDLSSPHRPVRLLARSQSSTFQISLTCVFPSCFRSSSLPFPWYIRPQHCVLRQEAGRDSWAIYCLNRIFT